MTIVVAILVFLVTFLFRFVTYDFTNDHFVHLSRARQILLGDLPVRDFFDPGLFLQYYASAGALILSGGNLLGEVILTAGCIALGAALTFLLATAITSSISIGLAAATLAAATVPRLYNYPKVFLYVLAFLCAWQYMKRQSRGTLVVLSLVTALAFLFRHDHGVYIAGAVTVGMLVLHWGNWRTLKGALLRYALVGLVAVLPWALFVQSTAGLWNYFAASLPQARAATTPRFNWLPFDTAPLSGWVTLVPPPEVRVFVRWADSVDEPARLAKEAQYGLSKPIDRDGRTWSYVLTGHDAERIGALVQDPAVEDTHGIDRNTFQVTVTESLGERLQRLVPLLRLRMSSGVMTDGNALAWLYYVTILLPVVAGALLLAGYAQGRVSRAEAACAAMMIVLCLAIDQGILRDYPGARLADVMAPSAVLGAWVVKPWPRTPGGPPWRRWGRLGLVTAAVLLTIWSANRVGQAWVLLQRSTLISNPAGAPARVAATIRQLERRPIDLWNEGSDSGPRVLARYLLACTMPSDRVLVTWFGPELFFYAERGFAGGQVYLFPGWHASDADQRLTVERMRRQRVPIVLIDSSYADAQFRFDFPIVYKYVIGRYRVAAESDFGFDRTYTVLADSQVQPSGTYGHFDLPCYR